MTAMLPKLWHNALVLCWTLCTSPGCLTKPYTCLRSSHLLCCRRRNEHGADRAVLCAAGCATASSRIDAIAISQAKYDVMYGVGEVISSYCANPQYQPLSATVSQVGSSQSG